MRMLICTFVVRIWHKTHFLMAQLISISWHPHWQPLRKYPADLRKMNPCYQSIHECLSFIFWWTHKIRIASDMQEIIGMLWPKKKCVGLSTVRKLFSVFLFFFFYFFFFFFCSLSIQQNKDFGFFLIWLHRNIRPIKYRMILLLSW